MLAQTSVGVPGRYHRGTRRARAAPPAPPQGRNVTDTDSADIEDVDKFDPGLTQRVMGVMRPFLKTYFRSEVHGLNSFPPGGALVLPDRDGQPERGGF